MTIIDRPFPTASDDGADREELASIVLFARWVIQEVRDRNSEWFLSDPELLPVWDAAWREVEPSFDMAVKYLREPPDPRLLEAQLAHAGQLGAQGEFKRGMVTRAWNRFKETPTKAAFKMLLGWLNVILGSIGFVPGIDAAKEAKEGVEQLVDDTDDIGGDAESKEENAESADVDTEPPQRRRFPRPQEWDF